MKHLLTILIIILLGATAKAKVPFQILDGQNNTIPKTLYQYHHPDEKDKFDATVEYLQASDWEERLWNDQGYVDGFWLKYKLINRTDYEYFGLDHQNNFFKLIYVLGEDGETFEVHKADIGNGIYGAITGDHFYDNIKIKLPKNEIVTVYTFFQSKPYNRWHGKQNPYEMTSIGEWKSLLAEKINRILIQLIFTVFCGSLALYLLIHLIVDYSKTYLWMFLLALNATILFTMTELGIGFYIGLDKFYSISGVFSIILAAAIFSFNQFAYDILQHENFSKRYEKLHYTFQVIVIIFGLVNIASLAVWPTEYEMNLNENPIKDIGFGPSILPTRFLTIFWITYLGPLVVFTFISAIKRRANAFYMLVSISVLLLVPLKYIAISFLPAGETLNVFMSNELIVGIMFLMMATTASEKIKTTEKGLLQSQILLKEAYSRFVPTELTDHLNKESIVHIKLGDQEELQLSILFSDIRDFTSISEKLTPEDNFKFINEYLNRMVPLVKGNNGFVNKFVGDSIMALYPVNAEEAVNSAVEMCQVLREYNLERNNSGAFKPIKIGIGINTGTSMLGTLGDQERMEASVISSTVNVASRLETLTKEYKTPVLISGETLEKLPKNRFRTRWIDRVAVKGQIRETDIHELIDAYADEDILLKQKTLPLFKKGLESYWDGDRNNAKIMFEGVLAENPKDTVAKLYLERCAERREKDRRVKARMNLTE